MSEEKKTLPLTFQQQCKENHDQIKKYILDNPKKEPEKKKKKKKKKKKAKK